MHTQTELITPARMRKDLETAQCGRNPSPRVIENYSRDMQAGNWHLTHQGIAYDERGILRDGQQRGWAVIDAAIQLVKAGVIKDPEDFSVEMSVSYDVPGSSFPYFDGGKNRSLADTWGAEGEEHPVLLQSIVRRVAMWEAGHITGNAYRPTKAEVMEALLRHPEARKAAAYAKAWNVKPAVPPQAVAGFLWYLTGRRSEKNRDVFMEYLRNSTGLPDEKPGQVHILSVLRNRLHGDFYDARREGTSVRPETIIWLCLRAWAAWDHAEGLTKLQLPKGLTDKHFGQFKEFR